MRLDRILLPDGFSAYAKQPSALWADSPIRNGYYLFPSDDFGLYIDIYLGKPIEQQSIIMPLGEPDTKALEVLHQHSRMDFVGQRYSPTVLRTAAAWTSHIMWLGASMMGLK
jgi:hypothetical protein